MRTFLVAGIGVAVLIQILLITRKNKSGSDKILTVWMFLILVHLFLMNVSYTGDIYDFPFLLGLEHPLPLLHGVLLFLYTCSLTGQGPAKKGILLLHFLPAGIMYAYIFPFFFLPAEQKIAVYVGHGTGYEVFQEVKWYAIALSGIIYVSWSATLLRRHRHAVRDQFSDLHRVNLRWLQVLTLGMGGIWFLVIFFRDETLVMAGVVTFIFIIGFFGVRQTDIFITIRQPADLPEQKKKYPKSGLTEETAGELHQALIRLMTEEAPYKKSDLSITDLAATLGVHPNYLSQVINQTEKKNFYDFVNTYRIEEFKRLVALQKNEQFTLLALAYDCGFSSKSSFNRYFKRATGQTPSEYLAAVSPAAASPA